MRFQVLASTLAALVLAVWADVDVPITQHWNGGFQGEACFTVTAELHGWTMTLHFSEALSSLDVWIADVTQTLDGGHTFVLTNKDFNADEQVGDRLCIGFQGHGNGDIVPTVTAELSGQPNGGQGGPLTTTTTTTTPPPTDVNGNTLPTTTPKPPPKLTIVGDHFEFKGQTVFLSGANMAWASYAYDFGDGQFQYRRSEYERVLKLMNQAGANSLRVWVHIQGETSPAYDSSGYVTGLDKQGTFINDFLDLLDMAQANDIWIVPCLWNAAVNQDGQGHLDGLVKDEQKLQSYIDNALTPWVKGVKHHPALGSWDIMNEPEGMLIPGQQNADNCYDTTALVNSGAGWAGQKYTYQEWLRFLNRQAAAIKKADPLALVSVGVSNPKFNTDEFGLINHYSDDCLRKAGGEQLGTMDFWQFHSYSWQGNWDVSAAFVNDASDYLPVDRPIVVGEFWTQDGGGMTIEEMFTYVYTHGYAGAWSWDIHSVSDQANGLSAIASLTSNGVIPVDL